jgi:hypothetical protein
LRAENREEEMLAFARLYLNAEKEKDLAMQSLLATMQEDQDYLREVALFIA